MDGSLASFKARLDSLLANLPDQPNGYREATPRAQDHLGNQSNSIKDWICSLGLHDWPPTLLQANDDTSQGG